MSGEKPVIRYRHIPLVIWKLTRVVWFAAWGRRGRAQRELDAFAGWAERNAR